MTRAGLPSDSDFGASFSGPTVVILVMFPLTVGSQVSYLEFALTDYVGICTNNLPNIKTSLVPHSAHSDGNVGQSLR